MNEHMSKRTQYILVGASVLIILLLLFVFR